MPVVDTEMWIGCEQRDQGLPEAILPKIKQKTKMGTFKNAISFKFYTKPMTYTTANLCRNAAPTGQQIATIAQEIIRRCKNTSTDLPATVLESSL